MKNVTNGPEWIFSFETINIKKRIGLSCYKKKIWGTINIKNKEWLNLYKNSWGTIIPIYSL